MRWLLALCFSLCTACGGGVAPSGGGSAPPPREPATKAEPAFVTDKEATAQLVQAEADFQAAGNDCEKLCKALASMTHATERLCELAKSNGDEQRCTDAKTKLDAARAKVKSTCGGCG